jgi:hypothetical protein
MSSYAGEFAADRAPECSVRAVDRVAATPRTIGERARRCAQQSANMRRIATRMRHNVHASPWLGPTDVGPSLPD